MSGLEFTESVIQTLAWPITLVIVVITLRGKLEGLFDRVTHAEGWGFKTTFANNTSDVKDRVDEAVVAAPDVPPAGETGGGTTTGTATGSGSDGIPGSKRRPTRPSPGSRTDNSTDPQNPQTGDLYLGRLQFLNKLRNDLAHGQAEPVAALLTSWEVLRGTIESVARDIHPELSRIDAGSPRTVNVLVREGIISSNLAEPISELRQLRNQAAHSRGAPVTKSAAVDFVDAALSATRAVLLGFENYLERQRSTGQARSDA